MTQRSENPARQSIDSSVESKLNVTFIPAHEQGSDVEKQSLDRETVEAIKMISHQLRNNMMQCFIHRLVQNRPESLQMDIVTSIATWRSFMGYVHMLFSDNNNLPRLEQAVKAGAATLYLRSGVEKNLQQLSREQLEAEARNLEYLMNNDEMLNSEAFRNLKVIKMCDDTSTQFYNDITRAGGSLDKKSITKFLQTWRLFGEIVQSALDSDRTDSILQCLKETTALLAEQQAQLPKKQPASVQ